MKRKYWVASTVCVIALAAACSKQSTSPTSPTTAAPASSNATADGSTLKVSAPTPVSPINGVKITQGDNVVLTINNSSATYAGGIPLRYEFAVINPAGQQVFVGQNAAGAAQTSVQVTDGLDAETQYQWHARAFYGDHVGPWSNYATFISPANEGYIRGNELYDPLINGKTIGTIHGEVTFIPGLGVKLENDSSYIEYELPQTVVAGEYSALVSGLGVISRSEDPKWRVLTMREGYSAINDNEYRMSVDKRGNGAVAWRFITGSNRAGQYIETTSRERIALPFHEDLTYFVRASWGGGVFSVLFQEGGFDGRTIYDVSRGYDREYTPVPHVVVAGSPYQPGDRGEPSTVGGMIIRQIWVSSRPRPAYANK
jgi:hypothetical protein